MGSLHPKLKGASVWPSNARSKVPPVGWICHLWSLYRHYKEKKDQFQLPWFFYHLRQLRPLCRSLPAEATKTLVPAFISCRLDYCNSLLCRVTDKLMRQVQSVQNAAARLITGAKCCEHITPILRQLHWLPVRRRVEFKMASLVYQVLSSKVPGYLADDIHLASESSAHSLRSSSGESALSLVFTVVLVTDVLLQLDHVSGTTYLPVCETWKSAAQNSENNWKHSCFRWTAADRDFFDHCAL